MTTFTQLTSPLSLLLSRSLIGCGWQWLPTWPASRAPPASTPNPTCAATCPGAQNAAWTRWCCVCSSVRRRSTWPCGHSRQAKTGCGVDVTGRITTNGAAGTISCRWVYRPEGQPPHRLSEPVVAGHNAVYVTVPRGPGPRQCVADGHAASPRPGHRIRVDRRGCQLLMEAGGRSADLQRPAPRRKPQPERGSGPDPPRPALTPISRDATIPGWKWLAASRSAGPGAPIRV